MLLYILFKIKERFYQFVKYPQFSLMTKAGGDTNETGKTNLFVKGRWNHSVALLFLSSLDHMQTTGPCVSDHDLSKLVALSPLFKTLQEIQQSLQNLSTDETRQHCHNGTNKTV